MKTTPTSVKAETARIPSLLPRIPGIRPGVRFCMRAHAGGVCSISLHIASILPLSLPTRHFAAAP